MENQELNFEHVLTRKFTFGEASIIYTDNGVKRKAELRYKGQRMAQWEGDDNNKWIASALYDFARQLRTKSFTGHTNYAIFCCIGYAMAEKNVGRYWHEYNNPNEIQAAIATCQARTSRLFKVPGNKLQDYNKPIAAAMQTAGQQTPAQFH